MANHLGSPLSRLVRERAYRAGDLKVVEQQEAAAREKIKAAVSALRAIREHRRGIEEKLKTLDAEIVKRAAFDAALIRPIRACPRLGPFRYGEFRAEMIKTLKEAARPVTTRQVVMAMVRAFGMPFAIPAEREATRRRVVETLRTLARRGAIQRLHDTSKNAEGLWLWEGL
ncbi:hypothetical protein [Sulfurisoma sediminicola]|uniref:Uncharacterized protein n=1 Tax=Sulfurisoma sediminicola TaxID=1381557 RepID=A0A497XB32_9PROT|nr:hypothetical protein [Sulfurisoma sediminicola]RLJ63764.1 hypothetical protein DFR35_2397 [Sulfurisoma sediminicola]